MADCKPQFDHFLGGSEELPFEISIMKIASARAQEIVALTEAIEDPQKTALVFQRLPKLMRRRVMSHNAKRMPRRLREVHLHQLEKSGLPPKPKRPSRRYRRRPQNLLLEYNRRQKKFVWLETHIWHAKRFHMINKWGYKLANFPNDKSFRACYRASANHCLLQDISFYCCIELCGQVKQLLEGLASLTDTQCGLTFGAKAFLSGCKEGALTVFHPGRYPFGAIGSIRFLWKCNENIEDLRTLWLWIHPANYMEILSELIVIFYFSQTDTTRLDEIDILKEPTNSIVSSPVKKKAKIEKCQDKFKNVEQMKLATRNNYFQTPKYHSATGNVCMTLLKDTINRFRLTGPLSQAILSHALKVPDIKDTKATKTECTSSTANLTEKSIDMEVIFCGASQGDLSHTTSIALQSSKEEEKESWWADLYRNNSGHREAWQTQRDLWASLRGVTSPALLSPHAVLALTVVDPRIQMPAKRTKVLADQNVVYGQEVKLQPSTSRSPIWDAAVRNEVACTKQSVADLARKQSCNLVPGFMEEEQTASAKNSLIPLLLLQRPGSQEPSLKRLGFGCGWDVVVPIGWGMPLWLALVFRGARVGGLREAAALEFEGGGDPWSGSFAPDTAAGREEANTQREQLAEQHFRLPPSKRPNYIKLGIVSPFFCCWDVLIRDWCQEEPMEHSQSLSQNSFYVLRDRDKLYALKSAIVSSRECKCRKRKMHFCSSQILKSPDITTSFSNVIQRCLVPSTVIIYKKGCVSDFAIICIPIKEDMVHLQNDPSYAGPVEPLHNDSKHQERKEARSQHQKLLRRLRKKRVQKKRRLEELESNSASSKTTLCEKLADSKEVTAALVDEQASRMRTLWLPDVNSMKDSCSRIVIGFVCKGDFSFTEARGVGMGYVVLPGLLQLMHSSPQAVVLVRNPASLQYRFAMLHIH